MLTTAKSAPLPVSSHNTQISLAAKLNTQHAEIISDIQDVLTAEDKDIPTLITTKVIEHMTTEQQTAQLKLSNHLFKESAMTMKWHTHSPDSHF